MRTALSAIGFLCFVTSASAQIAAEKTLRLDPQLGGEEYVLYESADDSVRTIEICAGSEWNIIVRVSGIAGDQDVPRDSCRIWTSDRIALERPEGANFAKVPVFFTYRYLGR